jgi:diguanylate cyclase (GGDEF)-like protein/PAS domain S-box-containing protein
LHFLSKQLKTGALQRAIFNSANFSSIATDAKGVIQIFNVGAERMLGYTAAEVMNKVTPADISDPQEVIARAEALSVELGTPITPGFEALVFKASRGIEDIYELTYIRKDGSRLPAVVSVTALRDAHDAIIGYLLIGTDNTARKHAEEALLKAGALQRAIFNSANFSSIATDAKGVIQIFNVGAERMLGYTAAEVMNKITPADISDPQEVIARAEALSVELGTPITPGFEALVFKASRGIEDIYELTYFRKDGSRLPAVVSVTALRDAQDAIIGYLLIGTDNTARKQVEEARTLLDQRLRDQQFYTRSLIESNIDALMMTDPQGIISDVNQQMMTLTGRTRDELIGAPCKNFFTDPARADTAIKRVLTEKKVSNYELTVRAHDGKETVVSYNAATFHDRDRQLQGVFAAARDVTERKRFERTLEEKNIELEARTADLQRFRTAMDATADAIFLVNRSDMRIVEVNATACVMLGYTHQELLQSCPAQLSSIPLEQLENEYDAIIAGQRTSELKEKKFRRKDGTDVQVEVHLQAQRSGADWIIVAAVGDITKRKETEKGLYHLAHYDSLTGLPNRTLFYKTLNKILAKAKTSGWLVAVFFIDLDQFKNVNDTLGHALGDELLIQFSNRLVQYLRILGTVGRLGGDEFALILVLQDGQQDATSTANNIREVLRAPFDLKGHKVTVTTSIGITVHAGEASDAETMIKYADTAMYRAKQAGRDTFRFFTEQMNAEVLARHDMEKALRKAVENDEFVLYYQPKVQLNNGRIVGLEALLRWQRPGHGLVSPQDFIPVLEETGLIVRVGSWVIATACQQIGQWMRTSIGRVPISVNVSGRQFIEGNLDGDVVKALNDNNIPADLLELELTESCLMANTERTISSLQFLKNLGVQISIDDFGTGYSSLAYLRRFPIDKLKIDITFIREVTSNPDDAAIVLAIIRMAHSLKLEVIAEGVETAAQLAFLRRHGCDQIQGYHFSPPLPELELEQLLYKEKHLPTLTDGSIETAEPGKL